MRGQRIILERKYFEEREDYWKKIVLGLERKYNVIWIFFYHFTTSNVLMPLRCIGRLCVSEYEKILLVREKIKKQEIKSYCI